MSTIKWSQIEAECGDYRAGFVATFRKYEGRDTDERDASNRIVKVTTASFARHLGVSANTFAAWVKAADQEVDAARRVDRTKDHAKGARSFARRLPPEEKAKLAAELLKDEAVAETPEARKAARRVHEAQVDSDLAEGFKRSEGVHPDDIPIEPFPADLRAEAVRIANRVDVSHDVGELLARADPDQRQVLVEIIQPRVLRVLEALGAGTVQVPDYVPDGL